MSENSSHRPHAFGKYGQTLDSPGKPVPSGGDHQLPASFFWICCSVFLERFAYYGMRAVLVLFLINKEHGLAWDEPDAYSYYGKFTLFVYVTPIIGGLLADLAIGRKYTLMIGCGLTALGISCYALGNESFLDPGMVLIGLGTGLFWPASFAKVGQVLERQPALMDSGFTFLYVALNLGALASTVLIPWVQQAFGFQLAFGAAALACLIAIIPPAVGIPSDSPSAYATPSKAKTLPAFNPGIIVLVIAIMPVFWLGFEVFGEISRLIGVTPISMQGLTAVATFFSGIVLGFLWMRSRLATPVRMTIGVMLAVIMFFGVGVWALVNEPRSEVFTGSLIQLGGFHIFIGLIETIIVPIGYALVYRAAQYRYAGIAFSLMIASMGSVSYIFSLLASSTGNPLGLSLISIGICVLLIVLGVGILLVWRMSEDKKSGSM